MRTSPPSASATPVLQSIGSIATNHPLSPRLTSARTGPVGTLLSSAVSIVLVNAFQALSSQVTVRVSHGAFGVV